MTPEILVSFLLISLLATATPGPSVMYVMSAGLSGGARGYGAGSLGVLLADALYFTLSVTGLQTSLVASYELFRAIKWVGAVYLIWLGLRLIWLAVMRPDTIATQSPQSPSHARWLGGGFMIHAANPKALLYFGAIVPQFLHPDQAMLPQVVTLGIAHLLTAMTVLLAYGFFAARIRVFAHHRWFNRTLYGASGSLLIAAGAGLASWHRE